MYEYLPGPYRGPFACPLAAPSDKLPYEFRPGSTPPITAISSNSWPGDELEQSRVDDSPPPFWDSLRPLNDSTSRLAVDIMSLTEMTPLKGTHQRINYLYKQAYCCLVW